MSVTQTSVLMGAVERDDHKKLQQLLSSNKDKQSISQVAKCLHMASLWGYQDCVDILLENGALTNVHDVNGNTPLIVAVRQDHVNIVKTLINAKCNINKATYLVHATPLHFAVSNGSIACSRLLIDAGADIEAQTSSGRTPLLLACRSGHEEAVALLIKAGAGVDKTDNDRAVALHFAAEENNIDCVRHLLDAGANVNLLTKYGDSALGLAARRGNAEVSDLLLDHFGRFPFNQRQCNMNPLLWASDGGHFECVKLLLARQSFNINQATRQRYNRGDFLANKGVTPLMLACRGGHHLVVDLLLSSKAEVDRVDSDGMTALLYATKHNYWRCVESLLQSGSNVNGVQSSVSNRLAISPLLTAINSRSSDCLKALLRANCAINMLGLLRLDSDPVLPVLLASQHQEDLYRTMRLFAIAQCQNPDAVKFNFHLMEADCIYGCQSRDISFYMVVSTAPSLALLCRYRIRCYLGKTVFHVVPLLPLPSSLKRFLLLNELEEED